MALTFAVGACQRPPSAPAAARNDANAAAPIVVQTSRPAPAIPADEVDWPPAPGTPGGLPDDRRPLPELNRDMTGPQGAASALETYVANVEAKRWTRAHGQWGDDAAALAFERRWRGASEVHGLIGRPGDAEGGCGSIYVDVPVQFYGTRRDGTRFNSIGAAHLRRVNGVDGATARQLAWHIASITLKDTM